jgi:long-chain acyl-CoA synthetase
VDRSELAGFFQRAARYKGEFVTYDDGYRGWTFSYPEIARLSESFAARLRAHGVTKGSAVVIWSENRPGWIIALWGCLLEGAAVVPVDLQSSADFFHRIPEKVHAVLALVGERVAGEGHFSGYFPVWRLAEVEQSADEPAVVSSDVYSQDTAEIVFTSGTTNEPKGVMITHGNLAAQIRPIEKQIAPYRKYVRPFRRLRFLNLLPMSHLFGQSAAAFIPPMIPASTLFISSVSPQEIVRQIHSRGVTLLVSVPKALEVLRDFILLRFPEAVKETPAGEAWPLRWWRFRAIHRMFGWRFWCVLTGGAPLPADLERFWSNLGFVVAQGYGFTETAPVISFNHPFHVEPGTAGKPIEGVGVKIAPDGEILVRGPNVTPGYFEAPQETAAAFHDGWFHTGDAGELDTQGYLTIRARKNEMIVTPEGFNVFPDDVEAALNRTAGVHESAVVGP